MAQRSNHYEMAFEAYLRGNRAPYVSVDEKRRSLLREASLKSMDFIVYSNRPHNLFVDVKGRRFPSGGKSNRHKWENWATEDNLDILLQWELVFGAGFRAVLVFAYHVIDLRCLDEFERCFRHRNRVYAFYGLWADQYRAEMRTRSRGWETVTLPGGTFRRLRAPIEEFL